MESLLSRMDSKQFDRIIVESTTETLATSWGQLHLADEVFWCFEAENPGFSQQLLGHFLDESESSVHKIKRICLLRPGELHAPTGLINPRLRKRDFIMPIKPSGGTHRIFEQGISRMFHHLCDIRVGISLAGGGARGLVHFGVLRALDRAGIFFDMISGTSAGAMFGLSYATGLEIDYMLQEFRENLTPRFPFSMVAQWRSLVSGLEIPDAKLGQDAATLF